MVKVRAVPARAREHGPAGEGAPLVVVDLDVHRRRPENGERHLGVPSGDVGKDGAGPSPVATGRDAGRTNRRCVQESARVACKERAAM